MSKILVSGLVNTETTVKVKEFPINYYPIDYPFFGISTNISGVAYNIASALKVLGDEIIFASITGSDMTSEQIKITLQNMGISTKCIKSELKQTPASVVLYDNLGRRQIYCDLKDIQEQKYEYSDSIIDECDMIIACNINFNRNLLKKAKQKEKIVATDVHVLENIDDEYNRDFMKYSDILFLSDEKIAEYSESFIQKIADTYNNKIIVLGRGSKGALMYVDDEMKFYDMPCVRNDNIVNTVGAGDALFSSFIHYYIKGLSPVECLKRAQIFASNKISFNGAAIGFMNEVEIEQRYKKIYKF